MDTTTIDCPSCNRPINIALQMPLCTSIEELTPEPYPFIPRNKNYSIKDLLYVHEELISENNYLREVIKRYEIVMNKGCDE